MDKRYEQFAKSLISYSVRLQKGEKILIMVPESARFSYAFVYLTVC